MKHQPFSVCAALDILYAVMSMSPLVFMEQAMQLMASITLMFYVSTLRANELKHALVRWAYQPAAHAQMPL